MQVAFTGKLWFWRGPSPFHFVTVPEAESDVLHSVANAVTYGWGMIPVDARIGHTRWATSLFPKDGLYLVPVKAAVRRAESLALDDELTIELSIDLR